MRDRGTDGIPIRIVQTLSQASSVLFVLKIIVPRQDDPGHPGHQGIASS
jgi:hypothetical protein